MVDAFTINSLYAFLNNISLYGCSIISLAMSLTKFGFHSWLPFLLLFQPLKSHTKEIQLRSRKVTIDYIVQRCRKGKAGTVRNCFLSPEFWNHLTLTHKLSFFPSVQYLFLLWTGDFYWAPSKHSNIGNLVITADFATLILLFLCAQNLVSNKLWNSLFLFRHRKALPYSHQTPCRDVDQIWLCQ